MLKPLLLSLALSVPALTITSVTFAANSTASNPQMPKRHRMAIIPIFFEC